MRILVTGSRGKVGSATVDALHAAGHHVTACDLGSPVFEAPPPGAPAYQQADLTDAGDAFAVVRGHDAVIHAAAIPEPTRNPPHRVFQNNLMGVFNTLEAAIRRARRARRSGPTSTSTTSPTRCASRPSRSSRPTRLSLIHI